MNGTTIAVGSSSTAQLPSRPFEPGSYGDVQITALPEDALKNDAGSRATGAQAAANQDDLRQELEKRKEKLNKSAVRRLTPAELATVMAAFIVSNYVTDCAEFSRMKQSLTQLFRRKLKAAQ